MKRYLLLGGLCVALGCAPSDSGDPAPMDDNTTSQVEKIDSGADVAAKTIEPAGDVAATTQHVSIEVDGMVCDVGCVAKVKETLGALPDVASVEVDFPTKLATVTPQGTFDAQRAVQALTEAGYQGTLQN